MKETWKNGKKTKFGHDFGPFWSKFGPKIFFRRFYLYEMLYILASYQYIKFQGNLMTQTWKNGKKSSFWPDLTPSGPKIFFKDFTSSRC